MSAAVCDLLADEETELLVSAVSIAELEIKIAIGKLTLPGTPVEACALLDAKSLDLTWEHAERLAKLPLIHRDPFDRLLICQALVEDLTFVTSDDNIALYPDLRVLRAS
jgi:PIN domain nuclease of toxin-antitoxin system